jgi:hypothetical protein
MRFPKLSRATHRKGNQRLGVRQTLVVNGLLSGFTGEGEKTVLPSDGQDFDAIGF